MSFGMLLSTAAYLTVAMLVTWFGCRRELREPAAELIRPKSPPPCKRVLLERVGFLWKRLSSPHSSYTRFCMLDIMASGDDSRTDRHVDHESMAQELNSVLEKVLKEREITILRECFGIGCHEKGLEEIGDQLGLTRERVRQIREKSIAKLRDSGNARILMKYLG